MFSCDLVTVAPSFLLVRCFLSCGVLFLVAFICCSYVCQCVVLASSRMRIVCERWRPEVAEWKIEWGFLKQDALGVKQVKGKYSLGFPSVTMILKLD